MARPEVTDEDALRLLDEAAVRLCRGYANRERIVYVVEDTGDGNVRVIGPSLPPEFVADLFERAAEGYAENATPECLGTLN